MRKLVLAIAAIVAFVAFLGFTEPGLNIFRAFGVPMPECIRDRWLYALGYTVPQCSCGNCSEPTEPQPPVH